MQIRVYYEDTDVGGVVYHSQYLNFCERSRSEAFFSRGLSPAMSNGHFVVKELHATYHAPAKLGDTLHVKNTLVELKRVSLKLHQEIYKEDQKLFELDLILASVDYEGKIKKLSKEESELLNSLFT